MFTALALVAFWIVAWSAYWSGLEYYYGRGSLDTWIGSLRPTNPRNEPAKTWWWLLLADHAWIVVGPAMALLPTLVLWASDGGIRMRDRCVVSCGVLFALSSSFIFWLAWSDSEAAGHALALEYGEPSTGPGWDRLHLAAEKAHAVSWPWLLLPLILTTAFVILSAWRRAVRDAEVEAVGEDE